LITCGFIFDIMPTCGSFRHCSATHLPICRYSNTFYPKIR